MSDNNAAADASIATDSASAASTETAPTAPTAPQAGQHPIIWTILGIVVLLGLGFLVHSLTEWVPAATKGTGFGQIAKSIEFPVYAILVGFAANAILSALGLRKKMSRAFRTEFLIKTGLVLLGASINFAVIAKAAVPALRHRILLSFEGEAEGVKTDEVIADVLSKVKE